MATFSGSSAKARMSQQFRRALVCLRDGLTADLTGRTPPIQRAFALLPLGRILGALTTAENMMPRHLIRHLTLLTVYLKRHFSARPAYRR